MRTQVDLAAKSLISCYFGGILVAELLSEDKHHGTLKLHGNIGEPLIRSTIEALKVLLANL